MGHWYKWFPGDYQRDTNHLSFIQDAAYRRLLDAYHSTGKLSANAENLLRVCRAITQEEQEAVRIVAAEFFTEENGLLVQDRVERSIAEIRSITAKRSEAGKKGAAATNHRNALSKSANDAASDAANAENLPGKKASIPEPEPEYIKPSCSPSASRSADDGFATFWEAYPKKVSKAVAEKAWAKIKPTGHMLTDLMAGLERQKASTDWQKDGGQFIPHPATWLNGRRWEDEIAGNPAATGSQDQKPKAGDTRARHGITETFNEVAGWVPA